MAELLKSVKTPFVSVKKGSIVPGTITKLTSSEVLVDIGGKTDAVVLEKDRNLLKAILTSLKVGDKVEVSILNPESDYGNTVVSLRRFMDEKLWGKLTELQKDKNELDITVDEVTRGGFLVTTDTGIQGFLPNSHAVGNLEVGLKTKATLLEFDKLQHKIVFSQKKKVGLDEFAKATKSIRNEQKVDAIITSIAPFGIFASVTVGETVLEGFIHVSEISWDKTETVPSEYKVGEKIEVLVLGVDRKSSRINLSIKRLTSDPNVEKLKSYSADKKVEGIVSKVISSGVILELEEGIEGFIKKDKIPVGTTYTEGAKIEATVSEVDPKNHRVILVPYLTKKTIGYR